MITDIGVRVLQRLDEVIAYISYQLLGVKWKGKPTIVSNNKLKQMRGKKCKQGL